jgi:hypothetical protein
MKDDEKQIKLSHVALVFNGKTRSGGNYVDIERNGK